MKLFDRVVFFNTIVVGFAFFVALLNPSVQIPAIKIPAFAVRLHSAEPHVAGAFAEETTKKLLTPTNTPTPSSTPTPTPIPISNPVSIKISSINVSAPIVEVGLMPENIMGIPQDFSQVGWYSPAGRPGETGSSILNGHYDDPLGTPAVFYNLKNLNVNDEIIITTENGGKFVFVVEDVFSHPLEVFPYDLLYEESDNRQLKLLTCDGVWNADSRDYSNRLVVVANLHE